MKWSMAAVLATSVAIGCGGDEVVNVTPQDASTNDARGDAHAAEDADASRDASAPDASARDASDGQADIARSDAFIDLFDVFPIPDGPIGDCVTCVRDKCGAQVNQCANSDVCRAGLLCTLTSCLADAGAGGPNLACVSACFNGDLGAAFMAIGTFGCIQSSCGGICLGGADGAAPDAPPPSDAPARVDAARDAPEPSDAPSPDDVTPGDATPSDAPPSADGPAD